MFSKKTGYAIAGLLVTGAAFALLAKNLPALKSMFQESSTQVSVHSPVSEGKHSNREAYGEFSTKAPKKAVEVLKQKNRIAQQIKKYKKLPAGTVVQVENFQEKHRKKMFYISKISEDVFQRMDKKSYKKDCTVPLEQLRYVRILYVGFDEETHVGELVVNRSIAQDVKEIFYKLYEKKYQLEKVVLVDEYDADDNRSMADNNTSSFNYRVVEGTTKLSKHSLGLAIDINPRINPYIHTLQGKTVCSPENGKEYQDRTKDFPHKIDTSDYAYKLFIQYGFSWGGAWRNSKDYQHFQKD